jgi:hypothetical protein
MAPASQNDSDGVPCGAWAAGDAWEDLEMLNGAQEFYIQLHARDPGLSRRPYGTPGQDFRGRGQRDPTKDCRHVGNRKERNLGVAGAGFRTIRRFTVEAGLVFRDKVQWATPRGLS